VAPEGSPFALKLTVPVKNLLMGVHRLDVTSPSALRDGFGEDDWQRWRNSALPPAEFPNQSACRGVVLCSRFFRNQ